MSTKNILIIVVIPFPISKIEQILTEYITFVRDQANVLSIEDDHYIMNDILDIGLPRLPAGMIRLAPMFYFWRHLIEPIDFCLDRRECPLLIILGIDISQETSET